MCIKYPSLYTLRVGRVAEGNGLENRRANYSVGSNPTLSAILLVLDTRPNEITVISPMDMLRPGDAWGKTQRALNNNLKIDA